MKNSLLMVLVMTAILPARAQKVIEKHFDLSANGFVSMNLQISDSIRIITWAKNEVYVKSTIDVNDNKNNDDYKMTFNESGSTVNITARLETNGRGCGGTNDSSGKNRGNYCCCCCTSSIYHEIYIPENTNFSVETINGNIVISGKTAEIRARSISGFIDLAIEPGRAAELTMKTISGTMYSNIELTSTSRKIKQIGGGTVSAELNGGGGKAIDLQTISGNIFFRKEG
jgi:hypothetical protein